jgi:hypothetical protein
MNHSHQMSSAAHVDRVLNDPRLFGLLAAVLGALGIALFLVVALLWFDSDTPTQPRTRQAIPAAALPALERPRPVTQIEQHEFTAAGWLAEAKRLQQAGRRNEYLKVLKLAIEYPDTKAAAEAKRLLADAEGSSN